jgi:hypothetical protein
MLTFVPFLDLFARCMPFNAVAFLDHPLQLIQPAANNAEIVVRLFDFCLSPASSFLRSDSSPFPCSYLSLALSAKVQKTSGRRCAPGSDGECRFFYRHEHASECSLRRLPPLIPLTCFVDSAN